MFSPKTFRFEGTDFVGVGGGEERRLAASDILAMVRANHVTRVEETTTHDQRKLSLGRAAMSGGLVVTKTTSIESKRVNDEREPVLYVFRVDGPPWLLRSTAMRYDGLATAMRRSKAENFGVLVGTLRELAPAAAFDTRLLAARAWPSTLVTATRQQLSTSTSSTVDLLAHIVAMSLAKVARPYR
jgi:hypothetical protein